MRTRSSPIPSGTVSTRSHAFERPRISKVRRPRRSRGAPGPVVSVLPGGPGSRGSSVLPVCGAASLCLTAATTVRRTGGRPVLRLRSLHPVQPRPGSSSSARTRASPTSFRACPLALQPAVRAPPHRRKTLRVCDSRLHTEPGFLGRDGDGRPGEHRLDPR